MMGTVQYLTNEQGQRTAVLLDITAYQQLVGAAAVDSDFLTGMSQEELVALAASQLAPAAQTRLDALLAQQKTGDLSAAAASELDTLLAQTDQLTILKTRARYTLAQPDTNR
jgi:hypothetical protein